MAERMAGSAIEAMRALTLQLDDAVEALIEAHDFSLAELKVTPLRVEANFVGPDRAAGPRWRLAMGRSEDGQLQVALHQGDGDPPPISLHIQAGHIQAGGAAVATLAEAVGLALSFVAFADQVHPPSA
jgi:hypothetical protein